ncbi:MAG TPA: cytochrome b/b6 domain-containing protein [Gammaproteobacteria bacterium]
MNETSKWVYVWDPLVRIGHWLLVVGFFTAYFTEDHFLTQHVWAGYLVGAVVLFRIFWGFVGPKHARFSDFVVSPRRVFAYVRDLFRKGSQRYLGHNPLGGIMILALLASLIVTTWSGLVVYAYEENAGPLQGWVSTGDAGGRDDEAFEAAEEFWESLHEFFANFTLLLVVLHIGGVIFSSVKDRENLVKAMFTGRKRAE